MKTSNPKILVILLVAFVALVISGCVKRPVNLVAVPAITNGLGHGIPNLAEVEPGVWRGGQPTDEGWKWLKEQGVVTVIKLNTDEEGSDEPAFRFYGMVVWRLPITLAQQFGIVKIPTDYFTDAIAAFPLAEAQRKQFGLPPTYKLNGNVFVHCEHGQDRTGLFVACYRRYGHQESWTKAASETEMLAHGFHKELRGLWEFWEDTVK